MIADVALARAPEPEPEPLTRNLNLTLTLPLTLTAYRPRGKPEPEPYPTQVRGRQVSARAGAIAVRRVYGGLLLCGRLERTHPVPARPLLVRAGRHFGRRLP